MESDPLRFWLPSSPSLPAESDAAPQVSVTLGDLAWWVTAQIEADTPSDWGLRLSVSDPPFDIDTTHAARTVPGSRHTLPRAAAPLAAALRHSTESWQDRWRERREPLAWRRRFFNGRRFVLWIEDSSAQASATIRACDEVTGATGSLRLPDSALRAAFRHFVDVRVSGLAGALGVGRHQHASPPRADLMFAEFLQGLLEAVYFEANPFRDEWEIRLPGLGPQSKAEELGEGFGPEIALALAPGLAPSRDCDANLHASPIGAGPLPPPRQSPSPFQRRRNRRFTSEARRQKACGDVGCGLIEEANCVRPASSCSIGDAGPTADVAYDVACASTTADLSNFSPSPSLSSPIALHSGGASSVVAPSADVDLATAFTSMATLGATGSVCVEASTTVYAVGDPVQGLYKALGKWFDGKIRKINGDGTYQIDWDDGDKADGIKTPAELRKLGRATPIRMVGMENSASAWSDFGAPGSSGALLSCAPPKMHSLHGKLDAAREVHVRRELAQNVRPGIRELSGERRSVSARSPEMPSLRTRSKSSNCLAKSAFLRNYISSSKTE